MNSKTYTKDDLKKLMRERLQNSNVSKKIVSPLAFYDEVGNLNCKICNIQIQNEIYWSAHLIDRTHKNNLEQLKKSKNRIDNKEINDLNLKRKSELNNLEEKKIKIQKVITAEDAVNLKEKSSNLIKSISQENLEIKNKNNLNDINDVTVSNLDLPKGFFDNPLEDAKVRNEIYQDPLVEEWEKFQKTIKEENEYSENLLESDYVETQNDRNIDEINEQIEYWKKINELEIKKENKKQKNLKIIKKEKSDSDLSDESFEDLDKMNLFSNWRSKKEKF